jgi:hypothetical protein
MVTGLIFDSADAGFQNFVTENGFNKGINGSLVSRQAQPFALPNLSEAQTVVYPNIMRSFADAHKLR